jgi:hypothetical protein
MNPYLIIGGCVSDCTPRRCRYTGQEILLLWNRLANHSTSPNHVHIGEPWQNVFSALVTIWSFIKEHDWDYLQFVPDFNSAVNKKYMHQPSKSLKI